MVWASFWFLYVSQSPEEGFELARSEGLCCYSLVNLELRCQLNFETLQYVYFCFLPFSSTKRYFSCQKLLVPVREKENPAYYGDRTDLFSFTGVRNRPSAIKATYSISHCNRFGAWVWSVQSSHHIYREGPSGWGSINFSHSHWISSCMKSIHRLNFTSHNWATAPQKAGPLEVPSMRKQNKSSDISEVTNRTQDFTLPTVWLHYRFLTCISPVTLHYPYVTICCLHWVDFFFFFDTQSVERNSHKNH